ncbi:MAG: O-antigen ligase family protein, partial [Solirubrobacteraceae bacterium]
MLSISDTQTRGVVAGQDQDRRMAAAPAATPGAGGLAAAAAPTLIAATLLLIAAWFDGAFAVRSWAPLAVFALVALAATRITAVRGPALAMAAALWLFACWSLASAAWSDAPGRALEGGTRNLLYAALVSLPLLTLPSRAWAIRTAQLVTCGVGVLVVVTLVAVLTDGADFFLAGRLDDPVGYRNGTAALFALAFWPLTCLAAERRAHALLRAACLALALVALGLAFLTQSRGVLLGFGAGAAVALAFGPDRLRRAWLAILAVCAVAVVSDDLLRPWDAFVATSTTSAAAVDEAVSSLAALALAGFGVALLLALFDGGLRLSERHLRRLRTVAAAGLALLSLAAVAVALVRVGDPVAFAADKAREFRQLEAAAPGETRLGSTGGQRYDLWRIAWSEFRSAPAGGVGEGGYPAGYYAERATDRNLSTPHGLPLRILAENGLVGALLFGAFLVAAGVALVRGWGVASAAQRRWASAMAAAGAVLLGQTVVDWLWAIPGLAGLGLLCLAIAVAIVSLPLEPRAARGRGWTASRVLPAAAAVVVALLFLADFYLRTARADRPARERLSAATTAARLDPLSPSP